MPGTDLPTQRECPRGVVRFRRAGGRSVIRSNRPCDRYCPRCSIPLLNAELTAGVAVETCRSCKGTSLDARDIATVTRQAPARPPEDVSFACPTCRQRKPFASAQTTSEGTECADCARTSPAASDDARSRGSVFGSFVAWLRGD